MKIKNLPPTTRHILNTIYGIQCHKSDNGWWIVSLPPDGNAPILFQINRLTQCNHQRSK